ncbi:MAG: hypothetical protein WKF42_01715 [Solirubrobacteraceae bacterium]
MHAKHRSCRLASAALLSALAAGLLASSPATADTVVVADPTAQNVTAYGATTAWSRRAADGRHRLVVSNASGVAADAAVRSSSVPFDPDLGPTRRNGRVVVYSRCAKGSTTRGCDVYRYDVGSRSERRITAISGRRTSEIGPSYFKGTLAFGRTGRHGGLFVTRAGRGAQRIVSGSVVETDLSMTRVIARMTRADRTFVRVSQPSGERARIVGRGLRGEDGLGTVVTSPVLARYRAFWLKRIVAPGAASAIVETVSVRSAGRNVRRVARPFAGEVNAVALGPASVPQLFSGAGGISRVDPPLVIPV